MIINSPWVTTSRHAEEITKTPVGSLIYFNGCIGFLNRRYEMFNKNPEGQFNLEASSEYATQQDIETRNVIYYVI